jgi:glutamate-ammonia-ligase adenylyltransferase
VQSQPDRLHENAQAGKFSAELFTRHPNVREALQSDPARRAWVVSILGVSRFLSEELIRRPEWIFEIDRVDSNLSASDYNERLVRFLASQQSPPGAAEFALFRRKELLRIVVRDQLKLASLSDVTAELSNLADAVLDVALVTVQQDVESRFGLPSLEDGKAAAFSVIALGKLGGCELNFSSDIDLMFLYSGNGETPGRHRISNREFFKKVANQLTNLLSTYTASGTCYRVDLRLRPEGALGELCLPLQAAKEYYSSRARDWELQMLIKARVCAGDVLLGQELLDYVEPLIYSTSTDFSTIETMSATRERIAEKVARRKLRRPALDVKLAPGGIRDIEFLVQCLQRLHGGRETWVRHTGTLLALSRLKDKDLLSPHEYLRLSSAYSFLRNLEHLLQLEDDKQIHALPPDPAELERVACSLFLRDKEGGAVTFSAKLLTALNQHLENVQSIYERIVHAQRPLYYGPIAVSAVLPSEVEQQDAPTGKAFPRTDVGADGDWENEVRRLSPYLARQLEHHPELVEEIRRAAEHPGKRWAFEGLSAPLNDIGGLRAFFRREMFRIQVGSLCQPEPIFQTLDRTSALAEFVIARAYRIALERGLAHAHAHSTPSKPFSDPEHDMMLVALGRLGMREFDLGSDADLIFIIPEAEAPRQRFWTRVVEHLIEILTQYAGYFSMLSIDTRLRPNGREGMLVQTESKYVDYFSSRAEAWEGIAYMKARGVAGDTDRATHFLNDLQHLDWRRYGQSGRSKQDLRHMRIRLQREQGNATPLKAAEGGYYDADFILMYLRLKGAGMFFKSLNTPERIDIVEKMGHLDRADAEFLQDATTYFRALDHSLRVLSGRAEDKIPQSSEHRQIIAELMRRWTGRQIAPDSLNSDLEDLQHRMRRVFDRIFGH